MKTFKVTKETKIEDILNASGIQYSKTSIYRQVAETEAGKCKIQMSSDYRSYPTQVSFTFGRYGDKTRKFVKVKNGEVDLDKLVEKYKEMVALKKEADEREEQFRIASKKRSEEKAQLRYNVSKKLEDMGMIKNENDYLNKDFHIENNGVKAVIPDLSLEKESLNLNISGLSVEQIQKILETVKGF